MNAWGGRKQESEFSIKRIEIGNCEKGDGVTAHGSITQNSHAI